MVSRPAEVADAVGVSYGVASYSSSSTGAWLLADCRARSVMIKVLCRVGFFTNMSSTRRSSLEAVRACALTPKMALYKLGDNVPRVLLALVRRAGWLF